MAVKVIRDCKARERDLKRGTFCSVPSIELQIQPCLGPGPANIPDCELMPCAALTAYIEHRFDVLGSGWVQVRHGKKCRGVEGHRHSMGSTCDTDVEGKWLKAIINSSNLNEAQRIWKLIDPDYKPIDWHIDFKSGYRWLESVWYKDIKFGNMLGVDVKVPWELARMQHLPQMALISLSTSEGQKKKAILQCEFRNQILDFIATNPPRFGVNWTCPMEVAIRAANWLIAYDLFCSDGVVFDQEFMSVFIRSIYDHGLHIVNNFEWLNKRRGNHYLANIAGLAFIATHLPSDKQIDAWLAFAVQELVAEVEHQFYPDGGNFEGSTAYHRFSAEMVYYATSLILGLSRKKKERLKNYDHDALKTGWGKPKLKPAPLPFYSVSEDLRVYEESPFPQWYFERMARMVEFIKDITMPNGHIPQVGDNDSGRFFKLGPGYTCITVKQAKEAYANLKTYLELPDEADYYIENQLDCGHLVAAAYGMFGSEEFALWLGGKKKAMSIPDYWVVRCLSGEKGVGMSWLPRRNKKEEVFLPLEEEDFQKVLAELRSKPDENLRITEFPFQINDTQCVVLYAYPDFGLYLFKNQNGFYLSIRCWSGREPFHTGHMHNDQLSIELWIAGESVVSDPGSYLYTPSVIDRNRYRSIHAHFTPWTYRAEPAELGPGLFAIREPVKARVLYFGRKGFTGKLLHQCGVERRILFTTQCIRVIDSGKEPFDKEQRTVPLAYSTGYGNRLASVENRRPVIPVYVEKND
ncbi:MAG: heparinase II/III family protein [Parachlamydia sp.]|nr:heparinase II/III family protein [Parachlamydia sp.]